MKANFYWKLSTPIDSFSSAGGAVAVVCPQASGRVDGAEVKMAGAVVGGVDGGLLRADVVRPDGGAGVLGSLGDKAAAGKEIDEGWMGGVQEFF